MSESQDQYNRGGMYAFMFSMVFVLSFMLYLVAIHPGVNLDEKVEDPLKPKTGEVAFDIQKVPDPWVDNEKVAQYGAKLYQINCSVCHGKDGLGDGPGGASLNPKPRNFVEGKWTQGNGKIAHFNVLTKGIPGTSMAAYGHLKAADRWALVQYIESVTQNKSTDDPAKVAEFAKTVQ